MGERERGEIGQSRMGDKEEEMKRESGKMEGR